MAQTTAAAVIYDMDGVIIDSEKIWGEVFVDFFAEHGHEGEYSDELVAEFMGTSREYWGKRTKEILGLEDKWTTHSVAQANIDTVHARMKERIDILNGFHESIHIIQSLGIRIALASGNAQEMIDFIIEKKRLQGIFEFALSSSGLGEPKPAPDVYLGVAKKMGVDPAQCIGIEDSPNGVQSVLSAGMKCIAVPQGVMTTNATILTADTQLEHLGELTANDLFIN